MAFSIEKLHATPYVCAPDAESRLRSLDPSVLALITRVLEDRIPDAPVDRVEVWQSTEPGNKGVVFSVYVQGDRTQALVLWFAIDGEVELLEGDLSPRARKQLAERVSIQVLPLL